MGWELELLPRTACERWEEFHGFLQGWGTRSQAQPESCRVLSHPFPAEDPGELPPTAPRNPVPQREPGCRHMEPRWRPTPDRTHLRERARIRMRAVFFAAVGALLLSPASCQSGKLFSYAVGWDCFFVSQESTESNLFYISHKLHPQRQSGILVIKRGTHGREEM